MAHARHQATKTRGRVGGAAVVGVLCAGVTLPAVVGGIASVFHGPTHRQTHNQAIDRLLKNVALDVAAYERNAATLQAQPPPPPPTTTTTTTTTVPPTTTTTAAPAPVTDATSVDTPDWACIRRTESGDGSASSDLYGFLGPAWHQYGDPNYSSAGAAPPDVQGQAALRLYRANGYKFSGAWNDPCTQSGGGSLR